MESSTAVTGTFRPNRRARKRWILMKNSLRKSVITSYCSQLDSRLCITVPNYILRNHAHTEKIRTKLPFISVLKDSIIIRHMYMLVIDRSSNNHSSNHFKMAHRLYFLVICKALKSDSLTNLIFAILSSTYITLH